MLSSRSSSKTCCCYETHTAIRPDMEMSSNEAGSRAQSMSKVVCMPAAGQGQRWDQLHAPRQRHAVQQAGQRVHGLAQRHRRALQVSHAWRMLPCEKACCPDKTLAKPYSCRQLLSRIATSRRMHKSSVRLLLGALCSTAQL